jgi:uncharacterized coiled-coil protein SlyX
MPPDNKIGSSTPPRITNHQDIAPTNSAKKKQQTGSLSQHASGASTPIYKPNNNEDLDISSLMAAFSGLQDSGYHDRDFEDTSFQPLVDVAKPKETLTPEQQEIANLKAKLAHKDKAIQDLSNQNKELKGELADLKTQLKDALSTIDKRVNDAVNHAVSNATAQYGSKIDELTNRLNQQQTPPQPQNYMPQNPNPYMQMQNPYMPMPMPMQSPFFMPNVSLMYGSATQSLNDSIMNMSKNIFENVGSMFYGNNNRQQSPMMMPMYNMQPQYGGNQYNPYNNPPPPPQTPNQSPNMHNQHNMGNNGMQNSGIPPQQKTQMPVFEEEQEPSYLDAAMNSMKTGGSAGNYANSPINRRMNTHSFADAILLDSIDNIKQSLKKNYPDFDTNSTSEFIETMSSNYDENQMKDPQFSAINAEAII